MGLKLGDSIPDFSLKDQNGNWFHLKELIGNKPLVIFFYPKDYTPGCTKEVCDFRDRYEDFQELGAEVVGISSDSEKMHQRFAQSYKLPFTLLSDKGGKVRKLFKVESKFFNLLPGRETFVVDKSGKLILVFNSINATNHMPMALKAIQKTSKK
ncbi:peroxiredoxin [Poritiphilus flavus]|uniref:thioredoxin-dependent peroxiredoxin n=1 Tax=Poritiphilus flavus TaxID=2697053 RepID=A0A6L9EBQ1_9FLAO|nr:peroxiredoxin [Poritiphilus flavus]NAS11829.1 redoxin domain-containing protein [Poritiphilus flavus]